MHLYFRALIHIIQCALPATALAHGDANTQPWLDGVMHVIGSPMCIAMMIGLALAALGLDDQQHYSVSAMAGIGAAAALLLSQLVAFDMSSSVARAASAACAVMLGLFTVSGQSMRRRWLLSLALSTGAAICLAAELDRFYWQTALSMSATVIVMSSLFSVALRDMRRFPFAAKHLPLAARITGAWIACLGLLLLALSLKAGLR